MEEKKEEDSWGWGQLGNQSRFVSDKLFNNLGLQGYNSVNYIIKLCSPVTLLVSRSGSKESTSTLKKNS
jgi:hypothetical protein